MSDDAEVMSLIVIGYDDDAKGIFSCLNFCFVYFSSVCTVMKG